jgi:hypothetical protein
MEGTKMRRILACGVLLAAACLPAVAANFSGKWAIQGNAGGGSGNKTVLTLNQVGGEVTGTVEAPAEAWTNSPLNNGIWRGKVEGNTLSFYVWTGMDQPAKANYRGTMSASGDEIVFTVTRAATAESGSPGSSAASTQQMTARRIK